MNRYLATRGKRLGFIEPRLPDHPIKHIEHNSDRTKDENMAPPHITSTSKHDRRQEVILLASLGWGYKRIAEKTSIPTSTVRDIIKRFNTRGSTQDAPRSGRPLKVTKDVSQAIESIADENPWSSLQDLTKKLHTLDIKIGRSSVNRTVKQLGFELRIPRKKPYLDSFKKIRRKYWCKWLDQDFSKTSMWWRRMVWLDECKVEFEGYRRRQRVRIKAGHEFADQNLAPSFRSGRFGVGCWAAFTYGSRTPLIRIRQRQPSERTSKSDRLGTNGDLYGFEINEPYLVPYLFSLGIEDYWVVQDNAGYHYSGENRRIYPAYGVQILPLPSSSPDLNPIENVWAILKARL